MTGLCLAAPQSGLRAQTVPAATAKLDYLVVFNRHGVRTPLWNNDRLNEYSTEPWPVWKEAVGEMTEHGLALMKLLGVYDREYLSSVGLIRSNNCADAERFYFWSDITPRDIDSGQSLAEGLFPGCSVSIHAAPAGTPDALFSPFSGDRTKPDAELSAAALLGRIGGHPETLGTTYRSGLEAMERILLGCDPGKKCPPEGKTAKQSLLDQPSAVRVQPGRLAQLTGPLSAASSIAEDFLLEYTDGMKDQDVGWGRIDKNKLREIMFLQDAYVDLELRTPYIARASASNLMSHMLRSMQQAVRGAKVTGALGKPGDTGLVIMGHDSDISNLGGLLGISWVLESYHPDARPPGAALVFELWRDTATGKRSVRTYILSQTLDQLRNATPLSLAVPPARAPIFVPGCSAAGEGWACDWDAFQRTVDGAIDPKFVTADAPVSRPGK